MEILFFKFDVIGWVCLEFLFFVQHNESKKVGICVVEGQLNPGPFNPRLFNPQLFNPGLFNHGFEKFMVEKSGVEKLGVEMSSL